MEPHFGGAFATEASTVPPALSSSWSGLGYKLVAKVGDRFFSIFAGLDLEYIVGEALEEEAMPGQKAGLFFCLWPCTAARQYVPPNHRGLFSAPRALMRCRCEGPIVHHREGRLSCSRLTVLQELPLPPCCLVGRGRQRPASAGSLGGRDGRQRPASAGSQGRGLSRSGLLSLGAANASAAAAAVAATKLRRLSPDGGGHHHCPSSSELSTQLPPERDTDQASGQTTPQPPSRPSGTSGGGVSTATAPRMAVAVATAAAAAATSRPPQSRDEYSVDGFESSCRSASQPQLLHVATTGGGFTKVPASSTSGGGGFPPSRTAVSLSPGPPPLLVGPQRPRQPKAALRAVRRWEPRLPLSTACHPQDAALPVYEVPSTKPRPGRSSRSRLHEAMEASRELYPVQQPGECLIEY